MVNLTHIFPHAGPPRVRGIRAPLRPSGQLPGDDLASAEEDEQKVEGDAQPALLPFGLGRRGRH